MQPMICHVLKHETRGANRRDRGFTLLEALVALAIAAAGLAAIGQLGFSSLAAARRAEARLTLTSAARAALSALPDRRTSHDGFVTGELFHDKWRLAAAPYANVPAGGPVDPGWTPQSLSLRVIDPSGGSFVIDTVRLRRSKP